MFGAIAGGIASALAGGAMSKLFGGGQKAASGGIQGEDRKSGSAGMPRPISYAVFCLKKKRKKQGHQLQRHAVGPPTIAAARGTNRPRSAAHAGPAETGP